DKDWLRQMLSAQLSFGATGVLGPVRPKYPDGTPEWVKEAGFFVRPEHPNGFVMTWEQCRTGNLLLSRRDLSRQAFDPRFGTGGGDVDFFRRMAEIGYRFVWCERGIVHETVIPSRCQRSVLLKRALLRGANSLKCDAHRSVALAKSILAIPVYLFALPIFSFVGHHLLMRYVVKLCDHAGRLLPAFGVHPVKDREFETDSFVRISKPEAVPHAS